MARTVQANRLIGQAGVSLVELMVAVVILLFVSLAMMQTALMSIESNVRNDLRAEGTRIAERSTVELRNLTAEERGEIANSGASQTGIINSMIRSREVSFNIENTLTLRPNTDFVSVQVFVEWEWKSAFYNTSIETLMEAE